MAKKIRKQISRALKRRYDSYEKDLKSLNDNYAYDCSRSVQISSQKISRIFNDYTRKILYVFIGFVVLFSVLLFVSSCNVTRVVTTSSEYYQRGDTSCMIQTKTVESYDASKKM